MRFELIQVEALIHRQILQATFVTAEGYSVHANLGMNDCCLAEIQISGAASCRCRAINLLAVPLAT